MSNNQGVDWPSWITAIGAIVSVVAAGIVMLLKAIFVTNRQLRELVKGIEETRAEQHQENLANFRMLFDRMGKVEQSQARTEGMLSGRYPKLSP